MALVSTSQNVTDQDATPIAKVSALKKGAPVRTAVGHIVAASFVGGTAGQWYTFVRVPARARVLGVYRTGGGATGALKFGLYRPGGIAISDAVFAAIDPLTTVGTRTKIDVVQTSVARTQSLAVAYVTAIGTAGATNDVEFDIAAAIVTAVGTPTDICVEVDYVLPE